MKRILFVAILVSIFAIGDVSAQVISYSQTKVTKLEKEKKPIRQFAGAEWGLYPKDPYASMTLGAYYEIGAMLNKSIFLGGGFSLGHSFNRLDLPNQIDYANGFYTPKGVVIKVYADAKFYLTKTRLKPYFDLAIGGIGCNECCCHNYSDGLYISNEFCVDIFANPQFGLEYQLGRNVKSVFINAGYFLPIDVFGWGGDTLEGFRIKLGITF